MDVCREGSHTEMDYDSNVSGDFSRLWRGYPGKWRAELKTPDGTQRVNTLTFKTEGDKLSGTVAGAQDGTPIKNGTITGHDQFYGGPSFRDVLIQK